MVISSGNSNESTCLSSCRSSSICSAIRWRSSGGTNYCSLIDDPYVLKDSTSTTGVCSRLKRTEDYYTSASGTCVKKYDGGPDVFGLKFPAATDF